MGEVSTIGLSPSKPATRDLTLKIISDPAAPQSVGRRQSSGRIVCR
jgi:hypothetical protein